MFSIPVVRFRGGWGYYMGVVRPSEAFPSVTLFFPDAYLGNGFSDFYVILQEYVLAHEDGPTPRGILFWRCLSV